MNSREFSDGALWRATQAAAPIACRSGLHLTQPAQCPVRTRDAWGRQRRPAIRNALHARAQRHVGRLCPNCAPSLRRSLSDGHHLARFGRGCALERCRLPHCFHLILRRDDVVAVEHRAPCGRRWTWRCSRKRRPGRGSAPRTGGGLGRASPARQPFGRQSSGRRGTTRGPVGRLD